MMEFFAKRTLGHPVSAAPARERTRILTGAFSGIDPARNAVIPLAAL
jgi:hypothetical protein